MHLRSVELRDWKAYESARFDFPVPTADRNVILVGAENGFGKTSLFEALVLGLFGRDGIALISRAAAAADETGRTASFRDFIERALNGRAIASGRTDCRIRLTFEDERGEPIEITRSWHFAANGKFRSGSDEISILKGIARRPVAPPASVTDPESWYRDCISRTFLPTHLVGFFLFDGEAASVYAERDMKTQVREGIEGLLGLTWLKKLREDLRDYAGQRRREVPSGLDREAIEALEREIAALERGLRESTERLRGIEADLAEAEREREALTRELAGYGSGTTAQLGDLMAAREQHARAFQEAQDQLAKLAAETMPLAIVGAELRRRVGDRLAAEAAHEAWLAARTQGMARIDAVLTKIDQALPRVEPSLLPEQAVAVGAAVREALDDLWNPPPPEAAAEFRHGHARGPIRARLCAHLEQAGGLARETVVSLITTMRREGEAKRDCDRKIAAAETAGPDIEEKKARLTRLNQRIDGLQQQKGALDASISSRRPQLTQKQADLARLTAQLDQSQRPARLARRAGEVAGMLENLIEEASALQVSEVAQAMTEAVNAMAHGRDLLNRVEIDRDGSVALLTGDGRDLRQFDLSAGEKQVFTQALFAAIARVSDRVFPLVIDTPLGRLDEDHRVNVLRYLSPVRGR
jgi:DNA sulfur modification protein DndD